MLSTVIISAAFSVGDTAEYSIEQTALRRLGHVDEIVQVQAEDQDEDDPFEGGSLISPLPMEQEQAFGYVDTFKDIPDVDGAVSVIRGPVAARNDSKNLGLEGLQMTVDFVGCSGQFALLFASPTDSARSASSRRTQDRLVAKCLFQRLCLDRFVNCDVWPSTPARGALRWPRSSGMLLLESARTAQMQ